MHTIVIVKEFSYIKSQLWSYSNVTFWIMLIFLYHCLPCNQLPWAFCCSPVPEHGLPITHAVYPCKARIQSMKPLQNLLGATAVCATSLLACPNTVREINAKYFPEHSFEFKGKKKSHFVIIWSYSAKYLLMYLTLCLFLPPPLFHQNTLASK